jgi:hypothetical protein
MNCKDWQEYNSSAQECNEYLPIRAVKNVTLEFGVEKREMEDAGCDSCTHNHNGECEIFRKRQ